MQSGQVIEWQTRDTYPIRQIAETWQRDPSIYTRAAASIGLPELEFLEAITKPEEREMNDLTTAALMLWYMTGVDIESNADFGVHNNLISFGDMREQKFDSTPIGKLFWKVCDYDFMTSMILGRSETNPELLVEVMEDNNPAHMARAYPNTAPMALGTLAAGEPWNEFEKLMWMMKDDWGPTMDWLDLVGNVRTTNREKIQKKYRDMSFSEANMLRTGELIQHMIAEIGFSKEELGMDGHGLRFQASYDYITNPDTTVRDFRWEIERVGIAMKIVLFLQVVDFLITNATVQPASDIFGNLENITSEKWFNFSKMPVSKPYNVFLSTPMMITKWQLAMLGNMGAGNEMSGAVQLMNAMSRAKDRLQLNKGSVLPRYGWVDNVHSEDLYNKFADSNDDGLSNGGGEEQGLMYNKSSSSEIVFKRTSNQDESGRNTTSRYVFRDLHAKWGIHRPENPLESGAGTHRGKSNIIRTHIS